MLMICYTGTTSTMIYVRDLFPVYIYSCILYADKYEHGDNDNIWSGLVGVPIDGHWCRDGVLLLNMKI